MKPIGGCIELDWEERSDLLDRRLGDGEIMADGLSLGAWGYVLTDFCDGRCWSSGLDIELEGVLLSRETNGFVKEVNGPGLVGLRGPSS